MSEIDLSSIECNNGFSDEESDNEYSQNENEYDNENDFSQNNNNYENENENENENDNDNDNDKYGYERRKKILILQFYMNEFPEKLKNYKKTNFEEMTDKELLQLREEFSFVIGAKSNVNMGIATVHQALTIAETVGDSYCGLKINGITNTLMNDTQFVDDIKCLCLDNLDLANVSPEKRIAFKVLSTGYILHNVNSQMESQKEKILETPQEKPDYEKLNKIQKISNKYSDL